MLFLLGRRGKKMNRVRLPLLCLFLVLSLLCIGALSRWVGKRTALAQIRSYGPRIARYIRFNESGTRSSGGNVIGSGGNIGFDAVRSDGAAVQGRYFLRPDGKTYLARRILFPQSGRNVVVMEDIRSISTTTLPENHPE